jgi:hypothetical protein
MWPRLLLSMPGPMVTNKVGIPNVQGAVYIVQLLGHQFIPNQKLWLRLQTQYPRRRRHNLQQFDSHRRVTHISGRPKDLFARYT